MFKPYLDTPAPLSKASHVKTCLWHYRVGGSNRGPDRPLGSDVPGPSSQLPFSAGLKQEKAGSFIHQVRSGAVAGKAAPTVSLVWKMGFALLLSVQQTQWMLKHVPSVQL